MREPYATLLAGLKNHPFMEDYLEGETPKFSAIYDNDTGPYRMLSGGEKILIDVARAVFNGSRDATVADLAVLDNENFDRVIAALKLGRGRP